MPKKFSLKTVTRRAKASDSARSEHQTLTVVTQPPVVTTRTLDGRLVTPGSAASSKYGTVKTTQMTVVETRVSSSSRAEGSSSSTVANETSQHSQASADARAESASSAFAIEPPKPAVRKKILGQQSDEWRAAPALDQMEAQSSARLVSAGGQFASAGLGIGRSDAPEDCTDAPAHLSQVPADLSAPQQLPASETSISGRVPTPTTRSQRATPTMEAVRGPHRKSPDELTAIRPSPATNINPSGPDTSTINGGAADSIHQRPQARATPHSTKGANPLTAALTPAPGQEHLRGGGGLADEDGSSTSDEPRQHYPKKVLLIVANEFCERFSYYGLRAVLVLYFHSVLGFSDSGSTVSFHLFAALCYLTPILGAILGDSILGKYKTILYLSVVYFLGELLLVLASVWWDLGGWSVALTWLALVLIGVGTGGIKPCVSAFGGDQFRPSETSWRESFFSLFYMAINLGSLISMFVTPMLRAQNRCVGRSDCYPLAFAVPCVLMFASIVIFLLASRSYYHAPLPEKNVLLAFCQCVWLALKRRLAGHKLPASESGHLFAYTNPSLSDSGSSLSATEATPVVTSSKQLASVALPAAATAAAHRPQVSSRRNHWLYLASDAFDANSIEEFRSCLAIFLIFLPTPVYWALYDQQSSLWTLQANRMDGRLFGTKLILEPDQMGVFNPLLLLASIPVFQLAIYPLLAKCRLLTTPIQRMSAGGFLMALTFVASALIELQIQQHLPAEVPRADQASLVLVNGLNDCSLVAPRIVQATQGAPANRAEPNSSSSGAPLAPPSEPFGGIDIQAAESLLAAALQPLSSHTLAVAAQEAAGEAQRAYKLAFRLASSALTGEQPYSLLESFSARGNGNGNGSAPAPAPSANQAEGCPLDSGQAHELSLAPLAGQSVRLLYVDQGNGKLGYKLFEDSGALPAPGKARVRLLYEFFGSYSQAQRRQFRLRRNSGTDQENANAALQFAMCARQGQVLLSDHLELDVPNSGDSFTLVMTDERGRPMAGPSQQRRLFIERGTRNLLVLHQTNAASHKLRQEVLQDNRYQISILWQLIPYAMISFSEVLFSITALEFTYASAPANMKSLVMAAGILCSSFGNLLTVAVESAHLFSNVAYDFLFYAAIMFADSVLFSFMGYHYEPYQPALGSQSSRARKVH